MCLFLLRRQWYELRDCVEVASFAKISVMLAGHLPSQKAVDDMTEAKGDLELAVQELFILHGFS